MNERRKTRHNIVTLWGVIFLTAMMMAGCQPKEETHLTAEDDVPNTVQPPAETKNLSEEEQPEKKEPIEISSPNASDKQIDSPQQSKKGDPASPGKKEKPISLLNVSLGDKKESVTKSLGTPNNTFVMEDETNPLVVYEYPGFSIGFNQGGTVEFVEVFSGETDPNLEGIKVGSKASDALEKLGKPASSTDYVITYIQSGVVLRFDVDPQSGTIQAIKLFKDADA